MYAPNLNYHPGDRLDHFQLDSVVATSGMATVFKAHDQRTGKPVAIKIPHPEVEGDPTMWERFKREEEIGTRIDHPGIMKVFPNPDRTGVYMVMEWVEGRLLRQIMDEEKPLPSARAVAFTTAVCHALDHIHANGITHRDLKPENVMVDARDHIHLIDFGIAGSAAGRRLTFAGFTQSMGTPDYIAPEQVKGKRGDARSDVYALGVMLYEMLTGHLPFSGDNPFAIMNDRLLNPPRPPRTLNPAISPQLQEILYRALEREAKNRYSSAREMAHDLEHQDEVGVEARTAEASWERRRSPQLNRALLIAAIALIPIAIFALLLFVSHKH